MKIESTTFLCDASKCNEGTTVTEAPDSTAAYLDLVALGWKVERPIMTGWKHYCPAHADKAAR